MRRQKRDMNSRAFTKGYRAGVSGKSRDLCPHSADTLKHEWMGGWRAGREDQWDGLTGVSGIHRAQMS